MSRNTETETARLDDAARAGWLYYIAGNTQEEIAHKLGVSRQTAQRLVSLSVSERLIKVRLDHPIARCLDLSRSLVQRYGLALCEVVPSDPENPGAATGVPEALASEFERRLETLHPQVIAVGSGKTLRLAVENLKKMECPQHRIVSAVGNIALDGTAISYDVIMRMAETIKAPHYPIPLPVIAASVHERDLFLSQRSISNVIDLALHADATFMGIGHLGEDGGLHRDGFVTRQELRALTRAGAVGEVLGWAFDKDGQLIEGLTNDRVTSVRVVKQPGKMIIAAGAGQSRQDAVLGALRGKLINGLITNEAMAEFLLS